MIEKNELDREQLKRFEPLGELSSERIDELMSLAYVEQFGLGMSLFREGEIDNQTLYLISGDVQLNSTDGRIDVLLKHDSDQARFPLDDSQPRQSTCVAMTPIQVLRIDNSILDYMMVWDQMAVSEALEQESTQKEVQKTDTEKRPVQKVEAKSDNTGADTGEAANKLSQQTHKPPQETNADGGVATPEKEAVDKKTQTEAKEKKAEEEACAKAATTGADAVVNEPLPNDEGEDKEKQVQAQRNKKADESPAQEIPAQGTQTQETPTQETPTQETRSKPEMKQEETGVYVPDRAWVRKMRHIMAFKSMPPANIKYLLERMEQVDVDAGEEIVKQGDSGDYYYVLVDGKAKVTRTIELANLEPGQSFGEEALLSGSKRNASVCMTEPGTIMRLAKKDFDAMLKDPLLNRISPDEARAKISEGAHWIDIRHVTEYNHGHLKDAINIPLHELRLRLDELDKEQDYICYCRTGHRSSAATFLLAQKGFKVSVLSGGVQVMAQDLQT